MKFTHTCNQPVLLPTRSVFASAVNFSWFGPFVVLPAGEYSVVLSPSLYNGNADFVTGINVCFVDKESDRTVWSANFSWATDAKPVAKFLKSALLPTSVLQNSRPLDSVPSVGNFRWQGRFYGGDFYYSPDAHKRQSQVGMAYVSEVVHYECGKVDTTTILAESNRAMAKYLLQAEINGRLNSAECK